jgi:hypothetical protein
MKKIGYSIFVLMLVLSSIGIGSVEASARTLDWVVSITYQNVGTAESQVSMSFFQEGSPTPVVYDAGTLAAGAAASLYIGRVTDIAAGFRGNAVVSSSQPLVATVVQFHQNAPGETVKMRMLSNGLSAADGSHQYLLATALGNTFSRTSIFSVQNLETEEITATFDFYNVTDGALLSSIDHDIPASSSKYIETDVIADTGLPSTVFNGSVVVSAVKKSDGTTPANIVAAASELYTNKNVGANFEGIPLGQASDIVYVPSALCKKFGLDTYYAVQNASLTSSAEITVTYYNQDGTLKTEDGPYTIGPGQKKSINTCAPSSGVVMTDYTGSAVISAADPASQIVALGKAQASVPASPAYVDVFTIFNAQPEGSSKMALPFVRWANDAHYNSATNYGGYQRSFIAIQNLETTSAKVNVKYIDKAGNVLATHLLTLPANSKLNSNPSSAGALGLGGMVAGEFGYYTDGTFGGGVIIEAHPDNPTAKFIAVNRVQHPGAGEDYNGISIEP